MEKTIKKFLRNSELLKILDFDFQYLVPADMSEESAREFKSRKCRCSILKALEQYCASKYSDLFSAHCGNCTIYIDGWEGEAAAYLELHGPEFIIAHTEGLTFDEEEDPTPIMGIDVHWKKLTLSQNFTIQK